MTRDIIDRYFTAINTEAWDDFAALLTEDATYGTTGARTRHGRDEVVTFFTGLFKAWSEHYDGPTDYIIDGDAAAVKVDFRGVSLSGLPIEFKAIDIFEFRGGLISSWSTWYDLGAVRKKLEEKPA